MQTAGQIDVDDDMDLPADPAAGQAGSRAGVRAARPRGVLITGSHRSGTTWVGKMIAHAPRTCYLHEPFKPGWDPPYVWTRFPKYFYHLNDRNAAPFERDLARTIGLNYSWRRHYAYAPGLKQAYDATTRWLRWRGKRALGRFPIVKDPIALFSAPYLAKRFDLGVVVMIRHPAAFCSSIKLKKWWFDFNHWVDQPELMQGLLRPFEAEVRARAANNEDLIDQAILQWRIFHHVIHQYERQHRDWMYVRHEDLSLDPVGGFRRMYEALGLDFTPACEQAVRSSSDEGNVTDANAAGRSTHDVNVNSVANVRNWQRRLTPEEVTRIRTGTEDVWHHYYTDADWA